MKALAFCLFAALSANVRAEITPLSGASGTSSVYVSSHGIIPANSTAISVSNLGTGVANSTRTFTTTSATRHFLRGSVLLRVSDSGALGTCGFLRNGAFFEGQGTALGRWVKNSSTAGDYHTWTIDYKSTGTLTAGTYSYALTCAASAGNIQVCSDGASYDAFCDFEAGATSQ